jgi:hypothetical protein
LIIALAANPDATLDLPTEEFGDGSLLQVAEPVSTEPRSGTTDQNATTPDTTQPRKPVEGGARRDGLHGGPVMGIGYDAGSLPLEAGFLSIGAMARMQQFSGALTADVGQSARAQFANGLGAKFRVAGVQLVGCVEPIPLPLRPSICLGPRLDALLATGYGATANFERRVIRPAGVVGIHLDHEIAPYLEVGLKADLLIFLRRPKFVIENVDTTLFQPAANGLRLELVAALRL